METRLRTYTDALRVLARSNDLKVILVKGISMSSSKTTPSS